MADNRITVEGRLVGAFEDHNETYRRSYAEGEGLSLIEIRSVSAESDFANGRYRRVSPDNGRTWGEWENVYDQYYEAVGEGDERLRIAYEPNLYDPVSGNMTVCGMQRYFLGGHRNAYRRLWSEGIGEYRDHCYLVYRRPDGTVKEQLLAYEAGADYDPENPRNPDYLENNIAYMGRIQLSSEGDLLIPLGASVASCCRILGLSLTEVFPSCPQLMMGVILVRAHWDAEREEYALSYSRPTVISDRLSSRGVCEPCVAELASGRIVIVFRGSNWEHAKWNTRIQPCMPGFKWYLFSDDGGKTFTEAMPWYFDSREVVYSSASVSDFFRSKKNGRLYWIGNVTEPSCTYENYPRYPLVICEVDDTYGYLKKDTVTVIDTRREGDSEKLQLSNYTLLENRETLRLEVRLAKLGMRAAPGNPHSSYSETWTYEIAFD